MFEQNYVFVKTTRVRQVFVNMMNHVLEYLFIVIIPTTVVNCGMNKGTMSQYFPDVAYKNLYFLIVTIFS